MKSKEFSGKTIETFKNSNTVNEFLNLTETLIDWRRCAMQIWRENGATAAENVRVAGVMVQVALEGVCL